MSVQVSPSSMSQSPAGGWLGEVYLDEEAFSVQRGGRSPRSGRAHLETGYTTQGYYPPSPSSLGESGYLDAAELVAPQHGRTYSDADSTLRRNSGQRDHGTPDEDNEKKRSASALGMLFQGRSRPKSPTIRSKSASPPHEQPGNVNILVDIGDEVGNVPSSKTGRSTRKGKAPKATPRQSRMHHGVSIEVRFVENSNNQVDVPNGADLIDLSA